MLIIDLIKYYNNGNYVFVYVFIYTSNVNNTTVLNSIF